MKLNEQQSIVVTSPLENSLVLAGAGTGKTSVLVERIAYLIGNHLVAANNILAITFTRKAANEIRQRCTKRLEDFYENDPNYANILASHITMGNFHSVFANILRYNIRFTDTDLKANFTIASDSVTSTYVKQLVKEKGYDKDFEGFKLKLEDLFASLKENLIRVDTFDYETYQRFLNEFLRIDDDDYTGVDRFFSPSYYQKVLSIFRSYEERLRFNNQLDFSDLLVQCYWLLFNNPKTLARYQRLFKYMLVDECQDMNLVQYKLIELLHNPQYNNVTMIGDDDQSIYGFRGACVELIDYFVEKFTNVKIYKLELNYRCSPNIIAVANKIINKHKTHNIKNLIAAKSKTDNRQVYYHYKYDQDAAYESLLLSINQHQDYGSTAVIARSNQSLNGVESLLIQNRIPYTKTSGIKFFSRAEIKVIFGFMRLVFNPTDNEAFLDLIKAKSLIAGFGDKKLEILQNYSTNHNLAYIPALRQGLSHKLYPPKLTAELNKFLERLDYFEQFKFGLLSELIQEIVDHCNLEEYFTTKLDKSNPDPKKRMKIVQDLIVQVERMEQTYDDPVTTINTSTELYELRLAELKTLHPKASEDEIKHLFFGENFISNFLVSADDLDNSDEEHNRVLLSTIHGVKGLEFNHVHIVDFDQASMPFFRSDTPAELTEERRLLYVAITRAKETLDIYYAQHRFIYGQWNSICQSFYSNEICSTDLAQAVRVLSHSYRRPRVMNDPEQDAIEKYPELAYGKNSLVHIQLQEHAKLVPPVFKGTEAELQAQLNTYNQNYNQNYSPNYNYNANPVNRNFTPEASREAFEQGNSFRDNNKSINSSKSSKSNKSNKSESLATRPNASTVNLDKVAKDVDVFDLLVADPNDPYSGNYQISPNLNAEQPSLDDFIPTDTTEIDSFITPEIELDIASFTEHQADFSVFGEEVWDKAQDSVTNSNKVNNKAESTKTSKLQEFLSQQTSKKQQQQALYSQNQANATISEVDEYYYLAQSYDAKLTAKIQTNKNSLANSHSLDDIKISNPGLNDYGLADQLVANNLKTSNLEVFANQDPDPVTKTYYSEHRTYLQNRLIQNLVKFVSRRGLELWPINPTAIEYLVDSNLVTQYFEIFVLPAEIWLSVPTINQTNIDELRYLLYKCKFVSPARVLWALDSSNKLELGFISFLMKLFKTFKALIKFVKLADSGEEFASLLQEELLPNAPASVQAQNIYQSSTNYLNFYKLVSNSFIQKQLQSLTKLGVATATEEEALNFTDYLATYGSYNSTNQSSTNNFQTNLRTSHNFTTNHQTDLNFTDQISFIPSAKPKRDAQANLDNLENIITKVSNSKSKDITTETSQTAKSNSSNQVTKTTTATKVAKATRTTRTTSQTATALASDELGFNLEDTVVDSESTVNPTVDPTVKSVLTPEQEQAQKLLAQSLQKSAQIFNHLAETLPNSKARAKAKTTTTSKTSSSKLIRNQIPLSPAKPKIASERRVPKVAVTTDLDLSTLAKEPVTDSLVSLTKPILVKALADMDKSELLTYLAHKTIMVIGYHEFLQEQEILDCLTELGIKVQTAPNFKGIDVVFVLDLTSSDKQDLDVVKRYNKGVIICSNDELSCLLD